MRAAAAAGLPFRESVDSDTVTVVAQDRFPPAPPAGLVAVEEGGAMRLFWNPSPERDVVAYQVYRRAPGEDAWRPLGEPVDQPLFLDPDVLRGAGPVGYRVTALDRAQPPNESAPSEAVEVVPAETVSP
jgi:hypothetical protein